MLVISKNTESVLLQELKKQWELFPTYRCLHFKSSQIKADQEEWFTEVLELLRQIVDDNTAQLYLCHDKDIFVLTRYITSKRVDDFLNQLSPMLGPALRGCNINGLANLFEIGVDWPKLRTLCNKKIENKEMLQLQSGKQQKKEDGKIYSREETISKINKDLIKSLAERREQRLEPEIMVVEDDMFSQKLVVNALKGAYSLSIIGDGQGALMNYVTKAPDILFLDIGLPDIDGHKVLKKLFEIDPNAFVVMFSGNSDRENIFKALEIGAKGFVGKPFTQDKLLQYIQKSPFIQHKLKREAMHGNLVH